MVDKLQIDVSLNNKSSKELKKIRKGVKDVETQVKKTGSTFKKIFEVAAGGIIAIGFVKVLGAATRAASKLFDVFITQGIAAAQVQEDAINQLNIALKASGEFSEAASEDLQKFASALQATTTFGDETILSTQALIQSLGQLSTEGLKKATTATLDLAAAMKIDLKAAALLVGKAAAGEVSSFSRYGLIIKKGATVSETFAIALKAINKQFGGAAAGQVLTFSGAMDQAANAFGDLQEEFGFIITANPVVISLINQTAKAFAQLSSFVDKNRRDIQLFIGQGLLKILEVLPPILEGIDFWSQAVSNAISIILIPTKLLIANFRALGAVIRGDFSESLQIMKDNVADTFAALTPTIEDGPLTLLADKLREMGTTAQVEFDKFAAAAEKGNKRVTKSTRKQGAEQVAAVKKFEKSKLQAVSESFGNIARGAAAAGAAGFAIQKAAAAAESVTQGILATQKALAAAPPPFNFILAATVAAAAAINTGKIIASKPPALQAGLTEVPGSFNVDQFPAILAGGERVVGAEQNADLKEFLSGGGPRVNLELEVSLNSETIFKAVQEELNSGRVLVTA